MCVYLMSAVAIQMEMEEGANSTVTDILTSLIGEEELAIPRTGSVSIMGSLCYLTTYLLKCVKVIFGHNRASFLSFSL